MINNRTRKRLHKVPPIEKKSVEDYSFSDINTYCLVNAEKIKIKPHYYIPATTGLFASLTTNYQNTPQGYIEEESRFQEYFDLTYAQGALFVLTAPDKYFEKLHQNLSSQLDLQMRRFYKTKGLEEFVLFWELPNIDKDAYLCVVASFNCFQNDLIKIVRDTPGVKVSAYAEMFRNIELPEAINESSPIKALEDFAEFDALEKTNPQHVQIYDALKSVSVHQYELEKKIKAEKDAINQALFVPKKLTVQKTNKKSVVKI